MTTQHTPTPWAVDAGEKRIFVLNPDGSSYSTAKTYGPNAVEDAAFIVRACNAHDELVAALCAVDQADALAKDKEDRDYMLIFALHEVRSALAKVQS